LRIYNTYIIIVAILLLMTTVILAATNQQSLGIYYTAYVIEALVVTELFIYFNKKARRGLGLVSIVLFSGFLIIAFLEIFNLVV